MKSKGTSKQNAEKNVLKSKTREKGARSSKKAEAASASVASSADSKVRAVFDDFITSCFERVYKVQLLCVFFLYCFPSTL